MFLLAKLHQATQPTTQTLHFIEMPNLGYGIGATKLSSVNGKYTYLQFHIHNNIMQTLKFG